jgi:hypothetical protein
VTKELRDSSKIKRQLYRLLKLQQTDASINAYFSHVETHERLIKNTKRNYFVTKLSICHGDASKIWKLVRETCKQPNRAKIQAVKYYQHKAVEDGDSIVEAFRARFDSIQKAFLNKTTNISTTDCVQHLIAEQHYMFSFKETNPSQILGILNSLDPQKASGVDEISLGTCQAISQYIAAPLSNIYNTTIK